ncbi:MAG: hypothetical protein Q8L37_05115 [Candidatus Gottesmanbacteria bacterium]|nr:hypothetical protein [Candidatus Gottesmanbacteria bacterium]
MQVSTEPGAWQVNTGDPSKNYTITLPNTTTTFVGTLHRVGVSKAEVFLGDGKNYTIFRGTFRFASCYDPSDDMRAANNAVRILVKENYNGTWQTWLNQKRIQDWTFSVLPGNFTCPTDVCPNPVPAATAPAPGATAVPAAAPSCPTFGGIQTTPGNDGGPYCKYLGSVVTDKVPAGWKAHYWDGKAAQFADPNTTVTTGNATFRRP